MRFFAALFLTLLTAGAVARAEVAPQAREAAPPIAQAALNEDIVARFLASYPEVAEIAKKHDRDEIASRSTETRLKAIGALPELREAESELKDAIIRRGFDDVAQWSAVGQSVVLAYSYARAGRKPGEARSQMAEAVARIENSPHVSDADKKRFVALMQDSLGFVGAIEPPASNIEVVARMGDAVGAVLDQ
jgi:hypothetical protein